MERQEPGILQPGRSAFHPRLYISGTLATPAITINGVYPQFAFVGRDAGLRHWNNRLLHRVGQAWKLSFSTALVRGRDQEQQEWLVWMPADRWSLGLHHHATPTNKASRTRSFWVPNQGGLEFQRVAHQSRVPLDSLGLPTVDYAPRLQGIRCYGCTWGSASGRTCALDDQHGQCLEYPLPGLHEPASIFRG